MVTPDFDLSCGKDWEHSYNPWKGKNSKPTGEILVTLPLDDWLCNKIEKLNWKLQRVIPLGHRSPVA